MSVSVIAPARVVPFNQKRARGYPVGLIQGSAYVAGDASGNYTTLSITIPGSLGFLPIRSDFRVSAGSSGSMFIAHEIAVGLIAPNGYVPYLVHCKQFSAVTSNRMQAAYNHDEALWPHVLFPTFSDEGAATVRCLINDNVNGRDNWLHFLGLAFDPLDVRDGYVDPLGRPIAEYLG